MCVCVISSLALYTGKTPLSEKDSLHFVLKTNDSSSHFLGKAQRWGRIAGSPTAWPMRWTQAIEEE